MPTRTYGIVVVLSLAAGLVGGALGNRFLLGDPVVAQEPAPRQRVVTAEQFMLVDKEGTPRAQLAVSDKGTPRLDLVNKEGMSIASLALTEEGQPDLRLNAKDGSPRIRLALLSKGQPRLDLTMDKEGTPAAGFGLSDQGWPDLRLTGKEGKGVATLLYVDGNPRLFLEDQKGQTNAVLATAPEKAHLMLYKDGKALTSLALDGLDLIDKDNHPRLRVELVEEGAPRIALKDKDGHRLMTMAVQPLPKKEEPILALYDRKDTLRAGLSLDEAGRPSLILRDRPLLSLIDKSGEDGLFLSLEGEDRPSFLISSKKGKHSAFLGLRENKEMALDLLDEKHKHRASLFLDPDGAPVLMLRDKEEKVVWTAPPATDKKGE